MMDCPRPIGAPDSRTTRSPSARLPRVNPSQCSATIVYSPNPKVAAAPEKKEDKRKFTEWDRNYFNGSTAKQYRYRQYEGDEKPTLVGEVVNGEVVPVTGAPSLPSDKKDGKKDEKSDDKRVSQN